MNIEIKADKGVLFTDYKMIIEGKDTTIDAYQYAVLNLLIQITKLLVGVAKKWTH